MRQDYYRKDTGYEVIDVIQDHCLSFSSGNVIKYICRAGRKPATPALNDYNKALAYIDFEIDALDRLNKGLNVRPIETDHSVYGREGESSMTDLSIKIGDAWGLDSSMVDVLVFIMRANRYRRTGRYDKAIDVLERAVVLVCEHAGLMVQHG